MNLFKACFLSSCLCALLSASDRGEAVLLWPNGAPGSEGHTGKELVQPPDAQHAYIRLSNIDNPSVLVYLPLKEKANGTAVIIAPGGGHQFLAMDVEGYEIADWLNSHGVAAFILKYRLARSPGSTYTVTGNALPDGLRAIRLVRSRAKEWSLDSTKVGFMGFSAGGEVAALVETRFDSGKPEDADSIERLSSRPDFTINVYPGFRPEIIIVPKGAPPAFLVCASDDRPHALTTAKLYLALEQAGVPVEMHLFERGGHGFGMRDRHAPVSSWNNQLEEWMKDHHLLPGS